jgi:hypothetical protein
MHARSLSFLGGNVLFCARRDKFSVNSTIHDELGSLDTLTKSFVHNSTYDNMSCFANFLYELIMLRERRLLNDTVFLTEDMNEINYSICTSWLVTTFSVCNYMFCLFLIIAVCFCTSTCIINK